MRRPAHSCSLCGYRIGSYDPPTSWDNLFRILYSYESQIAVTGVGFVRSPRASHLVAPLDSEGRWNASETNNPFGVNLQQPIYGRYGFPFHEACWSLLERAYGSEAIPKERLFEVCRSLPVSARIGGVTWGHNYGGLISVYDDSYPWEDLFVEQAFDLARYDPYLVPEIQQLPLETPSPPDVFQLSPSSTGVFSDIPLEIIADISQYLSTKDYLNARSALRSFYAVFHMRRFWASRFLPNADRASVFESEDWETSCDWLWLYHRTANGSPGVRNRERVWRLANKVKEILSSKWIDSSPYPCANTIGMEWREAAADVLLGAYQSDLTLYKGCREFHHKNVCIPPGQLSNLACSLVQLGDTTYVTGIRFVLTQGEDIRLGYIADEHIISIGFLTGFHLAVGSRGIQAIKCILGGDEESPWLGCPDNAPKTKRVSFPEPIANIEARFDGYKMISLGAHGCYAPDYKTLRNSAFWYPRIPEADLDLHEHGFSAGIDAMIRYEPISWTLFGGHAGTYLASLTGIAATIDGDAIRFIEFYYNSEEVPMECRKIGRGVPSEYAKTMHFKIDGPGGEVIDSLTVHVREHPGDPVFHCDRGILESFEVSTNYGRSHHFTDQPHLSNDANLSQKTISVVEGSTIKGLYWTQRGNRILALGAITGR